MRYATADAFRFDLWHIKVMKALKSPLASKLLADPDTREQLREFLTGKRSAYNASQQAAVETFQIRPANGEIVRAAIVPKAKSQ